MSPDGSTLVVASEGLLHFFSLADGRETATHRIERLGYRAYAFAWSGDRLTLPIAGPGQDGSTAVITPSGPRTRVLVHAADESPNPTLTWAADAIGGDRHQTAVGAVALWWATWHDWALIAFATLVALGGWLVIARGYWSTRS